MVVLLGTNNDEHNKKAALKKGDAAPLAGIKPLETLSIAEMAYKMMTMPLCMQLQVLNTVTCSRELLKAMGALSKNENETELQLKNLNVNIFSTVNEQERPQKSGAEILAESLESASHRRRHGHHGHQHDEHKQTELHGVDKKHPHHPTHHHKHQVPKSPIEGGPKMTTTTKTH